MLSRFLVNDAIVLGLEGGGDAGVTEDVIAGEQ